ncbi:hypothetical protein GS415_01615 [Rhodococcus hoagii]|nr:hypothetical protein [Prescottella equi]
MFGALCLRNAHAGAAPRRWSGGRRRQPVQLRQRTVTADREDQRDRQSSARGAGGTVDGVVAITRVSTPTQVS